MKPRILFIGHDAGRTGAPIALLHLIAWLAENTNCQVSILLKKGGVLEKDFRNYGRTVLYRLDSRLGRVVQWSQKRLPTSAINERLLERRIIRAFGSQPFDLIYINTIASANILFEMGPLSCPAVTHIHELDSWIRRVGISNLDLIRQVSTQFIVPSQAVKSVLVKKYSFPEEKTNVVYSYISTKSVDTGSTGIEIREALSIEPEAFVIGGSGLEYWRKGKDLFVQLALEVQKRMPGTPIHFLWTGGMEQKERFQLEHDIDHAGLVRKVHFVGQVSNQFQHYAAMDIFVLMSREDPFPLVCLEAATLGKPVLCFENAGGMPEFVEQDAGFVAPYLDVSAMADYCAMLAQDPLLLKRLGTAAAKKVVERCDVSVSANKIAGILNGLLPEEKLIKIHSDALVAV